MSSTIVLAAVTGVAGTTAGIGVGVGGFGRRMGLGKWVAGLGGAVAELLSEQLPTALKRIGMQDRFGESGAPDELLKAFGLTGTHIALHAHEMLEKFKV